MRTMFKRLFGPPTKTRAKRSEADLRAALQSDPTNPDLHVEMARLARAAGDRDRVRHHLDLAFDHRR